MTWATEFMIRKRLFGAKSHHSRSLAEAERAVDRNAQSIQHGSLEPRSSGQPSDNDCQTPGQPPPLYSVSFSVSLLEAGAVSMRLDALLPSPEPRETILMEET